MKTVCGCGDRFRPLGKFYVDHAKARTEDTPWLSFLYGLALTMTRNSQDHAEVISALVREFPTAEVAHEKCESGEAILTGIPELIFVYSGPHVRKSICQNSNPTIEETILPKSKKLKTTRHSWGHLRASMQECDRRGVRHHFTFQQSKGPDMMLLESGCQVPVMDVWMLRRYIHKPGQDEVAETVLIRDIQASDKRYRFYRNRLVAEANACAAPVGEFHTACWFQQRWGDDVDAAGKYVEQYLDAATPKTAPTP